MSKKLLSELKADERVKNKEILEEYQMLKFELWMYMEGLARGSAYAKDKFRNFFRHLETMVFGAEVSIDDISKL